MAAAPCTIGVGTHWLDEHLGAVTDVPRGRKGLWGALAVRSVPAPVAPCLAATDPSTLGRVAGTMFDIDPLRSIDLTVA
ncbi:MAG: hypothetical protein JST64_02425 [Actinobacteria bacterium]|nr:hypothetical protein [Actinomycetota bacterium]